MDISKKAAADTTTFHVRDAAGDLLYDGEGEAKKPVRITVYGPGSLKHRQARTARDNRNLERMQRKPGKLRVTTEQQQEDRVDFLTAITASFEGIEHPNAPGQSGELLFRAVYGDPGLGFIGDQVNEVVNDWESFVGNSPTS